MSEGSVDHRHTGLRGEVGRCEPTTGEDANAGRSEVVRTDATPLLAVSALPGRRKSFNEESDEVVLVLERYVVVQSHMLDSGDGRHVAQNCLIKVSARVGVQVVHAAYIGGEHPAGIESMIDAEQLAETRRSQNHCGDERHADRQLRNHQPVDDAPRSSARSAPAAAAQQIGTSGPAAAAQRR